MPKHNCKTESARLQIFLESCAREIGQASGFVQRSSKVSSSIFAQTLLLSCMNEPEASLNQMVQWSNELGVELTAQGLHKRMTERAVDFLARLVQRAIATLRHPVSVPERVLQQFNGIMIVDSSQVALPDCLQSRFAGSGGNASSASLKFHLCFDYQAGQVSALEAVAGRSPDQHCKLHRQQLKAGSLQLFDLGYFEQTALGDIAAAEAYFICRLHPQVGIYATAQATSALDSAELVRHLKGERHEMVGYVGSKMHLPVRIVFQRLAPQVVEERRRKIQASARRKGKTHSQTYLMLLEWAILITNVPQECLSFEQVMALYPIRWQIELVFKLWKSHAKLASVGQWHPQRVLCHIYARLLVLVLFHWLVAPWRFGQWGELSLTKAFQVFQRYTDRLAYAIRTGWHRMPAVLTTMMGDFLHFARKDKRRKSPSSFQSFILAGA